MWYIFPVQVLNSLMKAINALAKMQNSSSAENITLVLINAESFVKKLAKSVPAEKKVTRFTMQELHG